VNTPTTPQAPREPANRCRGDSGAGLVEYSLLLALIVVVCIGAVTFLGNSLDSKLSDSSSQVNSAGR
jgi:Flp pilus assembly pilin Flp